MPLKTVTIQHVYEVSFRIVSSEQLDTSQLVDEIEARLMGSPWESLRKASEVSARELCFDQDSAEYCLKTEGHRGLHEGVTGRRWGNDR